MNDAFLHRSHLTVLDRKRLVKIHRGANMKQRIKTLCAGGLLSLALFGVAMAGPLEDSRTAYQRGDYTTAMSLLRPLAEQGDAAAQNGLGLMFAQGHGVPQDYAQAVAWYRKAAEQGNAVAQSNLGVLYAQGHGVPQDYAQAVAWLQKAADQGDAAAQNGLGVLYAQGHGVPQDYAEAVNWYRKAADQGSPKAQLGLGLMFAQGHGVPQDYAQAYQWFNLAASRAKDAETQNAATHNRDVVAKRLTSAQIAEAQKMAREWKPTK